MDDQRSFAKDEFSVVDSVLSIKHRDKSKEVLVPDNMAEIYMAVKGSVRLKTLDTVRYICIGQDRGCFMMPRRRGVELVMEEGSECLVIKVSPLFARRISVGLEPLTAGVFSVILSDLLRRALVDCYQKYDLEAINQLISETFFEEIGLFENNEFISDSIEQIRMSHGNVLIKELYTNLEVSKSKLEQHFNKEIGLTPKEYCRIEKINRFIRLYMECKEQSLTELTYVCGYYDQSHLIKDFKYFLNISPGKFFKSL